MASGVSANFFLMRVTAIMNRGWLEADVANRLKPGTNTLEAPAPKMRINEAQLCWVHVAGAK